MTAPVRDGLAERAERLRGRDPLVLPHARERALLLLDIEFDRAARDEDWRRAAEIGYLTATLARA